MTDRIIDQTIPEPEPEDYAVAVRSLGLEDAAEVMPKEPATATPEDTTTPADDPPPGNREAARYRTERNQARAERDALQGRLETLQRAEVQRLAEGKLADTADIWRDGASVADLLDNGGNIDADKVSGLINGLVAQHPHWAPARGMQLGSRSGSGASGPGEYRPTTWAEAFRQVRAEA